MRPFLHRFPAIGGILLLAFLCATATTTSAGIVLISRLSDTRAYAAGPGAGGNPSPQQQTDFLPAVLSNSAMSWGEPGTADSGCTSNSRIPANIQKETLQILGDGTAHASVAVPGGVGFNAGAAAKVIVISFTLTDRSYHYLLTGQLSATGASGSPEYPNVATAKLITGDETVFEVIADRPGVTLAKHGVLQPNTYTFAVEVSAYAQAPVAVNSSSGNFAFLLRPVAVSTTSLSSSKTGATLRTRYVNTNHRFALSCVRPFQSTKRAYEAAAK